MLHGINYGNRYGSVYGLLYYYKRAANIHELVARCKNSKPEILDGVKKGVISMKKALAVLVGVVLTMALACHIIANTEYREVRHTHYKGNRMLMATATYECFGITLPLWDERFPTEVENKLRRNHK